MENPIILQSKVMVKAASSSKINSDIGFLAKVLKEFQPKRLFPSFVAGIVTAIMSIMIATAFAMLIFSGDLSDSLAAGIGLMIFGQMFIVVITAIFSSFKSAVSGLQDSPIVIFAVTSTAIIKAIPASHPDERFFTVVVGIALTSIITGLLYWILGYFKLGDFIRYIPYPVIGGFLAGTGLLLVFGSISIMADIPASIYDFEWLIRPELFIKWLPGIIFALVLIVVIRRFSHFLVVPLTLIAAIGVFYAVLWASNMTVTQAIDQGYLPVIFTKLEGGLWQPLSLEAMFDVNWSVLKSQSGNIFAVVVISVVGLLLNVTALEISTGEKVDLNQELKATGIANIFSGMGGSAVGFHGIGYTNMTYKINAKSRMVGIIHGLLCLLVLLFGARMLSFFPTIVLGGFLAFMGVDLLVTWLYDSWHRLPAIDHAMIVVIMFVINFIGILEGVGLGLLLTVFQFIIKYSRVSMVKHELSGVSYRSNVIRPRVHQQLLRQKGDWMYILELQGYIFFGTANELYKRIEERNQTSELLSTKYIIFDFRQVTGLDTSAVFSFEKIIQLLQNQRIDIIFTNLNKEMRRQMNIIIKEYHLEEYLFSDLDHGVEWCERRMIETFESVGFGAKQDTIIKQIDKALSEYGGFSKLEQYLERRTFERGEYLIRQNEVQKGLYIIEKGSVTVQLDDGEGKQIRIRTMGNGTIVGELGFFLGIKATASVVAEECVEVLYLSKDQLRQMEKNDGSIANGLYKYLTGMLCERVMQTNDVLQAFAR